MDENVLAAMARWPDVPDVFGWLSLSGQGQWRLHPSGNALEELTVGESITSPQILRFMDRNYVGDENGRWYFQNGPQKVFVRLDAAPYILHTILPASSDMSVSTPGLRTHNGLDVDQVDEWWLDDSGKLYAQTKYGPGLIAGRDLAAVLTMLRTQQDESLMDILARDPLPAKSIQVKALTGSDLWSDKEPAFRSDAMIPLRSCPAQDIPQRLGFVRRPRALVRIAP